MLLQEIYNSDIEAIRRYNSQAREQFKIRTELGPCPFEGDINSSPVVLLFANPGYDATSSIDDHKFKVDGWPLSGLHPKAPSGMRDWWIPRLRDLCKRYGDQYISTKVAALQINPWASTNFDSDIRLPSRSKMLELAESAAKRDAVIVIMRAERLWLESDCIKNYPHRYSTKSKRCSYITEGNLGNEAWKKINDVLATSKSI